MHGERADLDPATAHEVAGDVVDDLVAVDVGVVVGGRDGQRVVVELPRHEGADDEVLALEGLVDGRRLVDPSGDRLEIADVEDVGVQVAVPAHHVERMVVVVIARELTSGLDVDAEVARLRVRRLVGRDADVAMVIRRMLHELAVLVAVAARRFDLTGRLQPQHPLVGPGGRVQAPRRADGDDEVVARLVVEGPEDRLESPLAVMDVEQLVALPVAVEVASGHGRRRTHDPHHHVAVEEERDPAAHHVARGRQLRGLHQVMAVDPLGGPLEGDDRARLDAVRAGRRHDVVQERAAAREALHPEQLLGVQGAVRRAMLGVTLAWHAAVLDVVHGGTGLPCGRGPV